MQNQLKSVSELKEIFLNNINKVNEISWHKKEENFAEKLYNEITSDLDNTEILQIFLTRLSVYFVFWCVLSFTSFMEYIHNIKTCPTFESLKMGYELLQLMGLNNEKN